MSITLHYDVRKKSRHETVSEIGAILNAKDNPLGWGVKGANCDAVGDMMARRYLRDVITELEDELHDNPHVPVAFLKDRGTFSMFQVFSRRGYWRIQVSVPEGYTHRQLIADNVAAIAKATPTPEED